MEQHTEDAQAAEESSRLSVNIKQLNKGICSNFIVKRSKSPFMRVYIPTWHFVACNVRRGAPLSMVKHVTSFVVYAAISSGSLSLVATAIDSVFDIGSNVLLWWLHRKAVAMDHSKWPVGGARLETIGNIIYGATCCFFVRNRYSCVAHINSRFLVSLPF